MPDADVAGPSGQVQAELAALSTARQQPRRSNKATADQPTDAAEPDQAATDRPAGKAGSGLAGNGEAGDDDTGAGVTSKSLEELAVRFSQATKELQVRLLLWLPAFWISVCLRVVDRNCSWRHGCSN